MLDTPYGKSVARSQFHKIVAKQKLRLGAFSLIKGLDDYSNLCEAADYVNMHFKPLQKEMMFGNPLPKSYKDLGKSYPGLAPISLVNEINWTLVTLRDYSYEVSLFLNYKLEFEKKFLLGNLTEANQILDKIESEICCSLWTLESRFLIKEYTTSDSTYNKEFLSYFNALNEGEPITKSLAHFLSIRAEKNLSVSRYTSSLNSAIAGIKGSERIQNQEFYLFKLSFLNTHHFSKYDSILSYDFNHSVIDRYLTLRKVIIYLNTSASAMLKEDNSLMTAITYLKSRASYIYKKTIDPIFQNLKVLNEGNFVFDDNVLSQQFSLLIDKYTSGFYEEVELDCKRLLELYPLYFELYIIYIKSLVFQKKKFKLSNSSLQEQILNEMYKIVSVSADIHVAGQNLLRIANNITSCVLSYGLIDFVSNYTKGQTESKLIAKMSFIPTNPILYDSITVSSEADKFLEKLNCLYPDSITIKFLIAKRDGGDELKKFEALIPEVRYKTEIAKIYQSSFNYETAAPLWEYLIDRYPDNVSILETAIRNLFLCYQEMGRYDDCIKLFVDSYFKNNFIVEKIIVSELILYIKKSRFKNVESSIDLPIFYTLANADENEVHIAFEKFNTSQGVLKPSELLKNFYNYEPQKIVFFLRNTCSQEILKHSIYINGSKERLEERLEICRFLLSVENSENKAFYNDEIKYISNILIIQKGLLDLDESKIYVNEQGIINSELKDFDAVYSRFRTISKLMEKNKKIIFLNMDSGHIALKTVNENNLDNEDKLTYSDSPVYDIYKELFDIVKDKFLNSKFGIVAYLSTRIRHGVLLGEIRPIFEKHKLITQKEGDSQEYKINYYWADRFKFETSNNKLAIQNLLRSFSFEIDGLIFDLIKKFLQVHDTVKNPDGWFDYHFDKTELLLYSIRATKSKDFADFVKGIFELLWERTDRNLIFIREKIADDIAQKFNELFDRLEYSISEIDTFISTQEIITEIKACSTDVQIVIRRISNWFKRSGTQTSDFKLDNLIDIVFEHVNKGYPNKKILLEKNIDFLNTIKGEYYTHFADLFRIFFENILKHSDETISEIPSEIKVSTENDELFVEITNLITDYKSLEALQQSFKNQKIQLDKLLIEGKSGYHKALKIITSDLKNENNKLYTKTKDENFTVGFIISYKDLTA